MLGWRIGIHYYGQFVGVHQNDRVCDAWWTWLHLMSLLLSMEQLSPIWRSNQLWPRWSDVLWMFDESDNIYSPYLKWPWRGRWMKMSQCLMDEVTVDLICMALLSIGDGVRNHLRPIIAKSSKPISELGSGLVSSTHTVMSFFECLPCLSYERHQSRIPSLRLVI